MSTTVTGKLNKPAHIFQAGESTGFGIRLGVKYYDRETKQNEWTNYECALFARSPGQVQFYKEALIEGAIVEVSGKEEKIRQFEGNNGVVLSIEILNASLGFVGQSAGSQAQQAPLSVPKPAGQPTHQYQQPAPQGGFQQPPSGFGQQAPSGQPAPMTKGFDDFDDSIPF